MQGHKCKNSADIDDLLKAKREHRKAYDATKKNLGQELSTPINLKAQSASKNQAASPTRIIGS